MRDLKRSAVAVCVLASMLLLAGCPQGRKISEIMADPQRYMNKEVAIKGTVTSSYGALGTGMYEVDDGTGKMWVLSEKYGVPSKGTTVGVAGRVIPTATFGGRNFATVLQQTHQRKY